ncbi:ABC transporter substrate-binding protein [Branchiibius cervicis]|uniref:ABC transporter substrate-binding protein n=1 Tax=Branchiibius cervicis TaxID=908252 RepID=A0ABW2ATS5_9MICO
MKSTLAVVLVATVATSVLTGCGGSSDDSSSAGGSSTVKVAYVPLGLFAPLYVAQEKGYFKQKGITVQLDKVTSGQDAIPLAAAGKEDVVIGGFSAGLFSSVQSGLNIKVVGSMNVADGSTENTPTSLVVTKESGINSLSDMKGKKVAVLAGPGGAGAFILGQILKPAGLSVNDVTMVNIKSSDMPAAAQSGSVDAAMASYPYNLQIANKGGSNLAVPPKGLTSGGVVYGGDFAKNTKTATDFMAALQMASKDLQGDYRKNSELLGYIGKYTGESTSSLKTAPYNTWEPRLQPLPDQLTAMQEVWISSGALKYSTPIPAAKYVDDSFTE